MNARKACAGLSLACAIVFLTLGAGNASAEPTTAGECVKDGGAKDFEDAHCDRKKAGGGFGHVLFANSDKTAITAANDLTGKVNPFTFEGKVAGVVFVVECTTVTASGTVTNNVGGNVSWGALTAKFSACTSLKPEGPGCKGMPVTVADMVATPTGPHNLGLSGGTDKKTGPTNETIEYHKENVGTQMGLKLVPSGTEFTTLAFAAACGLSLNPVPLKGFMFATPGRGGNEASSGATEEFSKSTTIGGLTASGNTATLEGTLTFKGAGGNPLILTTTT